MAKTKDNLMAKIVSLAKRRGFVFQTAEIYGGLNSCYDYGPLGAELKNNIKKAWWKSMVQLRNDVVGLDSSILTPRIVWEASGHLQSFSDPLVECKKCHQRFAEDQSSGRNCPDCGGELTLPKRFNLLMKTQLGAVEGEKDEAYMRGETCQGIYLDYLNVKESMRKKLPFGIAQIGKAFRNEITPGNFIFRTREFEQMEMQYFVKPQEAKKSYDEWRKWTMDWYQTFISQKKNIRLREHSKNELAHYAKEAWDIEYQTPFGGFSEFAGVHNRGDWDLSRHSEYSKIDFQETDGKTKFIPNVVEVSQGVDRAVLMFLLDAYNEIDPRSGDDDAKHEKEIVLKFHPELAPVKAAVLPLSKKEILAKLALDLQKDLSCSYMTMYDETGSIGKRYRRQDEIGTPYCITVDFSSLEDDCATVRDRDTMKQDRVKIREIGGYLKEKLGF